MGVVCGRYLLIVIVTLAVLILGSVFTNGGLAFAQSLNTSFEPTSEPAPEPASEPTPDPALDPALDLSSDPALYLAY